MAETRWLGLRSWVEEGHSSIQAIPVGAWEGSTWSTRSVASMNDVDAEEHRQTMAGEERP